MFGPGGPNSKNPPATKVADGSVGEDDKRALGPSGQILLIDNGYFERTFIGTVSLTGTNVQNAPTVNASDPASTMVASLTARSAVILSPFGLVSVTVLSTETSTVSPVVPETSKPAAVLVPVQTRPEPQVTLPPALTSTVDAASLVTIVPKSRLEPSESTET